MCGIAGLWTRGRIDPDVVRAMADAVAHRGPDDSGIWTDEAAGIGLGHRRLAVIDLSEAGHQPMPSRCGRYLLTFNGEIYNHAEIRRELEALGSGEWRGHSDTETLLEGIARWGLAATLARTAGMFALALWDRETRRLSLARDRIGEKPLYYGWTAAGLAFASELKALAALPGFDAPVDRDVLGLYLRFNYVPTPWSIYRDIYKLEPASVVTFSGEALAARPGAPVRAPMDANGIVAQRYWALDLAASGRDPVAADPDAAVEELDRTLTEAVRLQVAADVPVGAFLSGGIDSSTVVALMAKVASHRVRTFTIGFHEQANNEADHAKAVARHLGTEHSELYITPAEARGVIPELPGMYDEPFADSSQIPTHLLSKLTRGSVTVALSGDGGDELFCGYNRYTLTRDLWRYASRLPAPLRAAAGSAVTAVPPGAWDRLGRLPLLPDLPMLGVKAHKYANVLRSDGQLGAIYTSFVEEWHGQLPLAGARSLATALDEPVVPGLAQEEQMMFWDMRSYLPDDILTKVDRAAMAVALEVRIPFLDHRVIEQAWRTPLRFKLDGRQGKWIVRRVLDRYVPRALIERPKAGFGIPVGAWLRGAMRDWAEELLQPARLAGNGLDATAIRARWQQHLRGSHDWTAALWSVLMFVAWEAHRREP